MKPRAKRKALPTPPAAAARTRWPLAVLVVLLGAAAGLRALAAHNDLWLDEIWTIAIVQESPSVRAILTTPHENNHILSTLFIYWMGPHRSDFEYRLLSVITGTLAAVLLAWDAWRRDVLEGILLALLASFSHLLIVYSSEARGYGPALLAVAAGFVALRDRPASGWPPLWQDAVFGAAVVIGTLSHLSVAYFYLAAAAWSVAREARSADPLDRRALRLARLHLLPAAGLSWVYFEHVRRLIAGGGDPQSLPAVVAETAAFTLGAPLASPGPALALAAVTVMAGVGCVRLWRRRDDALVFFSGMLLWAPAVVVLARSSDAVYPRHFLISVPFVLILAAAWLAALLRHGGGARVAAVLLVVGYLAGNGRRVADLLENGRGRYKEALAFLSAETREPVVTVGSDHDFRNQLLVAYHAGRERARFHYVRREGWTSQSPEWVLTHPEDDSPPPDTVAGEGGRAYRLVRRFPASTLSGWPWYVYRAR